MSERGLVVEAAVSVLIGRDAPELLDLLNETNSTENTGSADPCSYQAAVEKGGKAGGEGSSIQSMPYSHER